MFSRSDSIGVEKQGKNEKEKLETIEVGRSVSRQPRGLWKLFDFLPAVKRYKRLILIKQTQWRLYTGAKKILDARYVVLNCLLDHITKGIIAWNRCGNFTGYRRHKGYCASIYRCTVSCTNIWSFIQRKCIFCFYKWTNGCYFNYKFVLWYI